MLVDGVSWSKRFNRKGAKGRKGGLGVKYEEVSICLIPEQGTSPLRFPAVGGANAKPPLRMRSGDDRWTEERFFASAHPANYPADGGVQGKPFGPTIRHTQGELFKERPGDHLGTMKWS